jgi:putative MATE family efflux protein
LAIALGITVIYTLLCLLVPESVMNLFTLLKSGNVSENAEIIHKLGSRYIRITAISFIPHTVSVVLIFIVRAVRRGKPALIATTSAIFLNIFFNYGFMFGRFGLPELSFLGSAWGTVIARTVEMLVLVILITVRKIPVLARPSKMLKFSKEYIVNYFPILLPVIIHEVLVVAGVTTYTVVFNRFSDPGNVLAAVNLAQTMAKTLGVVIIGLGNATAIVMGHLLGSSQYAKAKDYAKKCVQFALFVGVILGALMFALSYFAPDLFRLSPESKLMAKRLLRVVAVIQVLHAVDFILITGILRAGGDILYSMSLESGARWLIAVPLCFIGVLVLKLEIQWVYTLLLLESAVKVVLAFIRYKQEKWIHVSLTYKQKTARK